jgi:VIT1/CCC1 family predicted Fe2+/Mn2+ transporter
MSRGVDYDHSHRDVTGGVPRAMVFGANDGLVSNVSLILGMAGGTAEAELVRLAGVAGLLAGAVSMAAGEYISMRAQAELLERELAREREALVTDPDHELDELAAAYRAKGIPAHTAREVAEVLSSDPERALEAHAREELGIDPTSLGSPIGAAVGSFVAFAVGAVIPLVPWLFTGGNGATIASVLLTLVAAGLLGAGLGVLTTGRYVFSAVRQMCIAAGAAGATYAVGSLIGVSVG